jgi:hypothetical protein
VIECISDISWHGPFGVMRRRSQRRPGYAGRPTNSWADMSRTQANLIRGLTTLLVLLDSVACAPMNPSQASLVGSWKVEWTCGVETLDLKSDGTYAYAIGFTSGGRLTDSGVWQITPKSERLSGAHVVLQNALKACSVFGDKLEPPNREDRALETVWEWGRMVLIFNPDIQGFTRG